MLIRKIRRYIAQCTIECRIKFLDMPNDIHSIIYMQSQKNYAHPSRPRNQSTANIPPRRLGQSNQPRREKNPIISSSDRVKSTCGEVLHERARAAIACKPIVACWLVFERWEILILTLYLVMIKQFMDFCGSINLGACSCIEQNLFTGL